MAAGDVEAGDDDERAGGLDRAVRALGGQRGVAGQRQRLLVVVDRALDHQRLRTEYRYLRSERDELFDHYGIIGRSRAMQAAREWSCTISLAIRLS